MITTKDYLEDPYHKGYKVQIDFYSYLLTSMGFDVHPTSYFLVCNAIRVLNNFNKVVKFDEYLIPYDWNNDWVEENSNMIETMNCDKIPDSDPFVEIVHIQNNIQNWNQPRKCKMEVITIASKAINYFFLNRLSKIQ